MYSLAKDNPHVIYDNGHCFVMESDDFNSLKVYRYSRGHLEFVSIHDYDERKEAIECADYFEA